MRLSLFSHRGSLKRCSVHENLAWEMCRNLQWRVIFLFPFISVWVDLGLTVWGICFIENSSMYLCPFKLLNFRNCCIYSFIQETQKFVFMINLNGLKGLRKLRPYPLCRWHFGHRWLSFHAKLCSHWSTANAIRKAISLESWLICNLFTKWNCFYRLKKLK